MAATAILTPAEFSASSGGAIAVADPRVGPLINGATAAIRRYCGWHIGPEDTVTDALMDADGGYVLVLPTLRLLEVTALSVRSRRDHVTTWTDYTVDELAELEWSSTGEIRVAVRLPRRWRGIRISYRHGFPVEDLAGLKAVIQQVVGNAIGSPLGATREQAGALAVSWAMTAPNVSGGITLLERDLALVNLFKLPGRA